MQLSMDRYTGSQKAESRDCLRNRLPIRLLEAGLLSLAAAFILPASPVKAGQVDSEYIQEGGAHLSPSLFVSQPSYQLKIYKADRTAPHTIVYSPNIKENTGLGLSYRGLGASGSWTGASTKLPEVTYGKTKYRDFQFNFYLRKIGIDATYQEYRSFYRDQAPVVLRPDLKMTGYGVNFFYIFSHDRFSFRAAFNLTERQKKSAGSFLLMASVQHLRIDSDSSLLPASVETDFGGLAGFKAGTFTMAGVSPGYAYAFVRGRWYLSPALFAGPAFQWQDYTADGGAGRGSAAGAKANLRLALGFNGEKFFAGSTFIADTSAIRRGEVSIEAATGKGVFLAGYRF